MEIKYKVIRKLQRFYSDEVYFQVHHCDTWEEVCHLIDPISNNPTPIKYYTHPNYGETWIFPPQEIGFSASPDTISYIVCVDNGGIW